MTEKEQIRALGRLTAMVERLTDMPHRVVTKVAAHPIEIVRHWLPKATIKNPEELTFLIGKIDEFQSSLPVIKQGDFWMGYYEQCSECNFRERLGDQIKAARASKGYTLSQLSESTGITRTALSRIENALSPTSVDMLEKICKPLGLSITLYGI